MDPPVATLARRSPPVIGAPLGACIARAADAEERTWDLASGEPGRIGLWSRPDARPYRDDPTVAGD